MRLPKQDFTWVEVSQELPEFETMVLLCLEDGALLTGYLESVRTTKQATDTTWYANGFPGDPDPVWWANIPPVNTPQEKPTPINTK